MIEYIIAQNPDDRILKRACDFLREGKLICFPTDTNWVVVCDPFNKRAVEDLYKFKGVGPFKHFSLLCASISTATEVAIIDDNAFRHIKRVIPGNYTFIFEASKMVSKNLKASKSDKEIGLRFPPSAVALKLLQVYGKPVLSTNVTAEQLEVASDFPIYSELINDKFSHVIAMIIDPGEVEFVGRSTIIDFSKGTATLVRMGAGENFLE